MTINNNKTMTVHHLKTIQPYFNEVFMLRKEFELRKNDRDYKVGDKLILEEWDGEKYTGKKIARTVMYILKNCPKYGLMDGFCIMQIA